MASISGVVTDGQHAAIPGATVTITNSQSGLSRNAVADGRGAYRFNAVAPGTYTVKISAANFGTFTANNVIVSANKKSSVDAELGIGVSITVDAAANAAREAIEGLEVCAVAFSPDGRSVVTANQREMVILWDANTGREIHRFKQPDTIHSVAFSPDGRYVLVAGGGASFMGASGGYARSLETITGREVQRFEGHLNIVNSAVFSPDGRYVLTGSGGFMGPDDNVARLFDANTGKLIRKFEGHTMEVAGVAFSPDGRYLATAGADGTIRLWDTTKGWQIRRFGTDAVLPEAYTSIVFSPDGRYVLTGFLDDIAQLWDTTSGKEIQRFEGHSDNVNTVAFSPDGRYVLTGSGRDHDRDDKAAEGDYSVRLWDTGTGREIRRFEGHTKKIRSVAFSPDGRTVLSGSDDMTGRLWSVATGKQIRKF